MPEQVPFTLLEGIGVVGVVLVVFWMLSSGRLVTKRELDNAVHDRDEWRAESRIKDQQLQIKDDQLAHMAEVGRTVDHIVRALQRGAQQPGGEN